MGYHRSQLAQRALRATVDRSWLSDDPLAGKIPDLTPCDYWLWGYKKSIVYRTQPSNLERRIYESVNEITTETRVNALLEFDTGLQKCVGNLGKHIE